MKWSISASEEKTIQEYGNYLFKIRKTYIQIIFFNTGTLFKQILRFQGKTVHCVDTKLTEERKTERQRETEIIPSNAATSR